ncbi:molybdopterin-guanine dinucleotide biosynthesis protein B [Cohnella hashimotonis]|uniref:Molybdopterin-guanine dinucleotide biosynthesis protein B n=1 Tax=Cohnella hashimotonis TaxID=2826895 RepID=A0ABT6TJZ3_9BACL|nr:molybdopterin-guanine dinucleotide biosynthesis protein B [Cohnella hashimotonis]MDI4647166.1 molybdopterin-guanine dinucleotide biosynthesis protein B [Cohnella hashimotonis]
MSAQPTVIQIVGYADSGKTTLLCALVRHLTSLGMTVATLKHHGHPPDATEREGTATLDLPDKDTALHLAAGAVGTGASSAAVSAVWTPGEASLEELAKRLPPADLILAEGFKRSPYAKWVLLRETRDVVLLDALINVIGVSASFPFSHPILPVVDRNEIGRIAALALAAVRMPL